MKNVKYAVAALLLSTVSFAGFAAPQLDIIPVDQQQVGVVSATGSTNLISLESQLTEKGQTKGVKSWRIASTSGQSNQYGTTVIYN